MEQLYPAAKWWFRIKTYPKVLLLLPLVILVIFVFSVIFLSAIFPSLKPVTDSFGWITMIYIMLLSLIPAIIISETYTQLAYKNWKYEFTQNELKIEKGIIWKVYKNIPYTKVQNIDIKRGILARLFGFSSLYIQTAGFSGTIKTEGELPALGIERAEQIREFILNNTGKNQGI